MKYILQMSIRIAHPNMDLECASVIFDAVCFFPTIWSWGWCIGRANLRRVKHRRIRSIRSTKPDGLILQRDNLLISHSITCSSSVSSVKRCMEIPLAIMSISQDPFKILLRNCFHCDFNTTHWNTRESTVLSSLPMSKTLKLVTPILVSSFPKQIFDSILKHFLHYCWIFLGIQRKFHTSPFWDLLFDRKRGTFVKVPLLRTNSSGPPNTNWNVW